MQTQMHAGLWAIQRLKVSQRTVPYVRSAHDVLMMVERLADCTGREQAEEVLRDFGIDATGENIFPIGWIGYTPQDLNAGEVHTLADATGTVKIVAGADVLDQLHKQLTTTIAQWLHTLDRAQSTISEREMAKLLATGMIRAHGENS